jgi:hypothetical protein
MMKYLPVEIIKNGLFCETLFRYQNIMENSMEIIFRESAKALGQIACQKLMNEVFKEEEAKPKKASASKKKEEAVAAAPAEARWSRWTKTYTDTFKKNLTDANVPCEEKDFDKLKKEFVKYLNDLTDEDYQKDTKGHPERMKDFVALKAPKAEEKKVVAGKAKADPKKKTMWEEMNTHETPTSAPSNAAVFHEVKDIEELRNNEFIVPVEGSPDGVFWDGKNGRWFQWPAHVEDEDLDKVKYHGVVYNVGKQSLRVFKDNDDDESYSFVGFLGIGMFRDMKMI